MPRQRRPLEAEEARARANRRFFPGSTQGAVRNTGRIPRLPVGRTGSSGGSEGMAPPKHFAEILKSAGVAPLSVYGLTYTEKDSWPIVVAGGVEQTLGIDFTIDSSILTILPAMDLHESDLLWARYNWTTSAAGSVSEVLHGSLLASSQPVVFPVPPGTTEGALLLVFFVGGWDIASGAEDWTLIDSTVASSGSNTTFVRVYSKPATAADIANGIHWTATGGYWWSIGIVADLEATTIADSTLGVGVGDSVVGPGVSTPGIRVIRCGMMRSSSGTASLSLPSGTEIERIDNAATPLVMTETFADISAATLTATGHDATAGIVLATVAIS